MRIPCTSCGASKGSAEWRKPLESGRVSAPVTEIKKTKEKERDRGVKILDHVLPEALGLDFGHLNNKKNVNQMLRALMNQSNTENNSKLNRKSYPNVLPNRPGFSHSLLIASKYVVDLYAEMF